LEGVYTKDNLRVIRNRHYNRINKAKALTKGYRDALNRQYRAYKAMYSRRELNKQ